MRWRFSLKSLKPTMAAMAIHRTYHVFCEQVVIQRLRRAGAAALAARIDDDCAIAIRYRFCLSARGHRPGPAVRPTAIVSGTPFSSQWPSQVTGSTHLITSPQPKAPAITTSDARTKAALNEPVLSTIQPVTTGPMIPAMLARQFWMPTQRPAARGPASVCVMGQSAVMSRKVALKKRLTTTMRAFPAAHPASPTAPPTCEITDIPFRTRLREYPAAISRSHSQPEITDAVAATA